MGMKDFQAVVMIDGKEVKQKLRFANFEGDEEAAKKVFNDLHAAAGDGQSIKSIKAIGDTPAAQQTTLTGIATPPLGTGHVTGAPATPAVSR